MVAELLQLLLVQQWAGEYPYAHIVKVVEQTQCAVDAKADPLLVDEVQPCLADQLQNQLEYDNILRGTYGGQKDLIEYIAHIETLLLVVVDTALPVVGGGKAEREVRQAEDATDGRQYLNTFVGSFLQWRRGKMKVG